MRKTAEHVRGTDEAHAAEVYLRHAQDAQRRSELVRQAVMAPDAAGSATKREDDT